MWLVHAYHLVQTSLSLSRVVCVQRALVPRSEEPRVLIAFRLVGRGCKHDVEDNESILQLLITVLFLRVEDFTAFRNALSRGTLLRNVSF